ncbi:sugar porter family MFS transporter [Frateuria defendens]|uniref:sugar porter family MFS transporter n=1 Tax=Frateuria defendens TaxID=2219559 RepID=UPI00066FCD7F|nr:sugar porter family MFS transporter [Frateuria defendens]
MSSPPTSPPAGSKLFMIGLLASLAGLMFGLDVGVISGAQAFIQKDFQVSENTLGWIVSSMMLGAALGALGSGFVSSALGRKRSLILGGFFFVLGAVGCALAWSVNALVAWRIVLGVAVGIASYNTPLYIAEIAPPSKRGLMVSSYQLMVTVGIMLAFLSNTLLAPTESWRWMLGITAIPGVLFVVGVCFLPYSPAWLVMQDRVEDAYEVLMELRGDVPSRVNKELRAIQRQMAQPSHGFSFLRSNRHARRAFLLGILMMAMQQFTGINVVMYYAPKIFEEMGYAAGAQLWLTFLIGFINVLVSAIAMKVVDHWGRKPALYAGFATMGASLLLVGFMLRHGAPVLVAEQAVTVIALLVFIAGCALSASPLMWVLCAEVQPLATRNVGIAASTVCNWVANMIVGGSFPFLLVALGASYSFVLYAALNALFVVFTIWLVPETRGVALDEIEQNLMAGKPLRRLGDPV